MAWEKRGQFVPIDNGLALIEANSTASLRLKTTSGGRQVRFIASGVGSAGIYDDNAKEYLIEFRGAEAYPRFLEMPRVNGTPIVEAGESVTGSWIKWQNGYMICATVFATVTPTYAFGSLYRTTNGTRVDLDWPQEFDSAPTCIPVGDNRRGWAYEYDPATTTQARLGAISDLDSESITVGAVGHGWWS